jgi:Predicted nucleotide-binding protein containing TIR-like domain
MRKFRVFIASSEKVHSFAKMIRDEINTADYCSAETWKDAFASSGAQSKIEALEQWIRLYDYAVILFAKADLLIREAGQDSKSHDDCVFEAGLFMAALGRQRSVLFTSGEPNALPSDLGGISGTRFTEPDDLASYEKCRPAVQAIASAVQASVQRIAASRSPANRPLTRDDILNRERMESLGGVLREDQVVVASVQPPELGYQAANQVRTNMDSNIRYVYFFQGNYDATDKIPQLMQLILLVGLLDEKDATSFKARRELVDRYAKNILELANDMCLSDKLNIFFLGDAVYPEFCIHNAANDKFATIYFKRDDDYFIEWAAGQQAYRFWTTIKLQNRVDDPVAPDAILHGGRDFGLEESNFQRALLMGMRRYFSSIADDIMDLCLRGPDRKRDLPGSYS